jgi:hypothetical protein
MLAGLFTRIRSFTNQIDQTVAEALNLIKSGVGDVSGARYADISGSAARYVDISGSDMRVSFDVSGSRLQPDVSGSAVIFPYASVPFDISGQNYTWTNDASGTRCVFLPQTNTTTFYDYTPNYYGGNITVACTNWSNLSDRFAVLDLSGGPVPDVSGGLVPDVSGAPCGHNDNKCACVCLLPVNTSNLNRVPTASGALEDECCGGVCQKPKKLCCFPFQPNCVGCWRGSCEICMSSVARSNTIDCECPTSPVCGPDVVAKGGCPCYPDAAACPKDGTACCSNDIEDAGLNKTD